MYWLLPCANQTSKRCHTFVIICPCTDYSHVQIRHLRRSIMPPTANVRNGLRLESHPVSKPLQAIRHINQANMFSHVSLPATTLLSHVSYICHHRSIYWPCSPMSLWQLLHIYHMCNTFVIICPCTNHFKPYDANQTSKEHQPSKHVLSTTTLLSHVYICHHMSMYWPFPCANQTSKEVHHHWEPCSDTNCECEKRFTSRVSSGIESLARTPTANVRNGLRLESHPVSKPLQAIRRINQANMFSHVSLPATTLLSHLSFVIHLSSYVHVLTTPMCISDI